MSASLEIQLIAVVVAVACALPGVFLVLRGVAMMSDAISHTVLLGIVLAYFAMIFVSAEPNKSSPWLIVGAAGMGLFTVLLVELLINTRLLKQDAAIGLVFPFLFSIAVLLISRLAANVHLDNDAVLLGEIALAPFDRFDFGAISLPKSLVTMGIILLVNFAFITAFYKELKLATFDAGLAAAMGFAPVILHYVLMSLVSITAVGAFDAVGSILVVALMIAPPVTAYLLTDELRLMLIISAIVGSLGAIGGFQLANALDANIAGSIATMLGIIFFAVLALAPGRGLIAIALRRREQKWRFAQTALAIHLLNHEGTPAFVTESQMGHLTDHLHWDDQFAHQVVELAQRRGEIERVNGHLELTDKGRSVAQEAMIH